MAMNNIPYLRQAFAIALAEARHAVGLTQLELADLAGLSRSYIAALEAGSVGFSGERLYMLAAVLQIDVLDFWTRIEELRKLQPTLLAPGKGKRRVKTISGKKSTTHPRRKKDVVQLTVS